MGEYGEYAAQHANVVFDPSAFGACDTCHESIAEHNANSLHSNLWGYIDAIEARGQCVFENTPNAQAGFERNCADCHTTCGQCHVSRPNSVGGGLVNAHKFRRTPDQTLNCTACHGSRVGHDLTGENDSVLPDIHYARGHRCELCHRAEEIHGDGMSTNASGHYENRYEVATMPRCENCHDKDLLEAANEDNPEWNGDYHAAHWNGWTDVNLQCQVCHSQPYKNCTNCHVEAPAGFTIEPSVLQLKIGKNTRADVRGEYDYTIVRHTPVDPNTYENWSLPLPGYDTVPTWKYASPHNVRAWTDQTTVAAGSCGSSCHDSPGNAKGYYLREADLLDEFGAELIDATANAGVVITEGDLH